MSSKNILFGIAASSVLSIIFMAYNKIFPNVEKIQTIQQKPDEEQIKQLKREKIFNNGEEINEELDPSILSKTKWSQYTEKEIKLSISNLIKNRLRNIFLRKGWNFENMSGRIYYDLGNFSIEIFVTWKDSLFSKEFTHYDRFEISLVK